MNRDYYLMRYPSLVKQADEGQAIEEHLGPLQHAYVADAVGADAMQRGARQIGDADEGGLIDTMMASDAARVAPLQRRIRHGAAGFAESPKTRIMGAVDPTMLLTQNPNASLTSLIMGTGKKDPDQEDLVSERYKHHIQKYQDKDNPEAVETTRETPYHKILQTVMAERDTEVAGDKYLRKNSPWHYWANPFAKSGPISELLNRMERRRIAGFGWPDSTLGRAGMQLGEIGTLGLLPQIMGDEEAQESLRRSAVKNKIYPDAAMPDKKAAALLLKCASFLVKQAGPMDWLQSAAKGVGSGLQSAAEGVGSAANWAGNAVTDTGSAIGKAVYDSPLGFDGAAKRKELAQPYTPPPQRGRGIVQGNSGGLGFGNYASALRAKQQQNAPVPEWKQKGHWNANYAKNPNATNAAPSAIASPLDAPGTKIDDNYTVPSQVDNEERARIAKYRSQLPERGAIEQEAAAMPLRKYQLPERGATQQLRPAGGSPATSYINAKNPVMQPQQLPNVKTSSASAAVNLLKCASFLVKQAH